jgi:hypothetical protein
VQRNKPKDVNTCGNKNTPVEQQNCGDHGDGNMLIVQHCEGTCFQPIFSQYAHLDSFDSDLNKQVLKTCLPENPSGTIFCPIQGPLVEITSMTALLGYTGGTGYGGTGPSDGGWGYHLHFEVRDFPQAALLPPFPKNSKTPTTPEYGYTVNHPDLSGYIDPIALLEGAWMPTDKLSDLSPQVVTVLATTNKRIGPDTNYSCHVTDPAVTNPSLFDANCQPAQRNDQFLALRTSPPTEGCSLGWYQIVELTFNAEEFASGAKVQDTYFPKGDVSRDGCVPAAWLCKGNDQTEWVTGSPTTISISSKVSTCK